jgi:hypothetical protein
MSNKITVGTVLYGVKKRGETYTAKVVKSGTKYFYVDVCRNKYAHDTLRYESDLNSMHNIQLFRSEQEILNMHERYDLLSDVSDYFRRHNGGKLTLEQLRTIKKIIDNEQ